MRKPIETCPGCHSAELLITQQTCRRCGVVVSGQFEPNIFSTLSPENLAFVEAFVKNRGNVKEMERELGVSYWAIRNQLNEVIEALGFEAQPHQAATADARTERRAVLAELEQGNISVEEATRLLKSLQAR